MTESARFRRAARSDRLRGFGSGWLVSIALHATALGAASLYVLHDPAHADSQPEEVVTRIDLRLARGSERGADRTAQTLPEAPPIARDVLPSFDAEKLSSLDAPRASDDATARDDAIERALALDVASSVPLASPRDACARSSGFAAQGGNGSAVHLSPRPGSGTAAGQDRGTTSVARKRGAPAGEGAGVLVRPELLTALAPEYPEAARRRALVGDVRCLMHVDAAGRVASVDVIGSSGSDVLDEAARAGLLRWRFRPATCGGIACACEIDHVVAFRLVGVHSRS